MKKIFFLFFTTCLVIHQVQSQPDSIAIGKLQQFIRNIHVFNRLVPMEKVYLHFDNTGYVLGDTIRFKAYAVNASDFLPDTLSGVLYAELLNEKGKVLETKKLKIENGQCHGDFHLSETNVEYFAGFYEIRAYTKAMLNFGVETVFSRVFPVFNEYRSNEQYTEDDIKADLHLNEALVIPLPNLRPKVPKRDKVHADFYPEGGNLVTGLTSNVAFRITDGQGRALNATGEILNPQGEILSTSSTEHAGMGSFAYTPDGNDNRVKITCDDKDYFFDLPESKATGYVLQTRHFPKNALVVRIEKNPQTPRSLLGLSVLCRGEVLFFQVIDSGDESCSLKIPCDVLGNGVHQITLFDSKGEIFAERLVFIPPKEQEQLRLEAIPDKTIYEPNDLIRIDFSVTGNHPDREAVFSLAVRDEEMMIQTNPGNIYTNLLLSSDLKGFIENPEDYFCTKNPNLQARKLDLLMMVQGWKRYEWQTIAGIKPFKPLHNPEKQLIINGHVASPDGKNIELHVSMENENKLRMDGVTQTDNKGGFYVYPGDFYGTWTLSLRSKGLSGADTKIRLNRWFSPAPKNYAYSETVWKNGQGLEFGKTEMEDEPVIKEIQPDNDSIDRFFQIKDVVIIEKTRKKKRKEYIHSVGMEIDRMIDLGEKIPYSVHDYLAERDELYAFGRFYLKEPEDWEKGEDNTVTSPFDAVIDRKNILTLTVRKDSGKDGDGRDVYEDDYSFYYGKPHIAKFFHFHEGKREVFDRIAYPNGKRTYDITVKELTAKREIRDVQKIVISGVRQQDYKMESFTPIYIYPYKDYIMREMPGIRHTTFEGFSVPQDYFHNRITDEIYRPGKYTHHRTLYWNPDVKTDEQGKASIRFYNNDFCRKINISAEGITKGGTPVVTH
jgi:hypothetical protein